MARIVLGSYMVRYPLGGMVSWVLQYLVGLQRLGHEVFFVEKSGYPNSCYDPVLDRMSDDCSYGVRVVGDVLSRYGLGDRWCYVDAEERYHGLGQARVSGIFGAADLFIDMGTHGAWDLEAQRSGARAMVDGEPGLRQMRMQNALDAGQSLPCYDFYFTNGLNIPCGRSTAPTAGVEWRPIFHPVATELFAVHPPAPGAAFSTLMNWQAYERIEYRGQVYGHKDLEFEKFIDLPRLSGAAFDLAVAGKATPRERLEAHGWRLCDPHRLTWTVESYWNLIRASRGEFSVCKHGFVATRSGWFSDRSAAYLASGRPVVMQDTGFSEHLPVGRGLFAVDTVEQAAAAIEAIEADYDRHSRWAREIAEEHLESTKVLLRVLDGIGIERAA